MKRLIHCFKAYVRSMQISRKILFIFIEGKITDAYFYGNICASICQPKNTSYVLCRAQELDSEGGGKQVLISFFQYLRRKSLLVNTLDGKTTKAFFFLDKDVDDLLRTQRQSKHVVYSYYYDVENHIFIEGDLIKAASSAASMDPQEVAERFGNHDHWCTIAATRWKQWVTLCLFIAKKKINSECNYRVSSRINRPLNGPVDAVAFENHLLRLENSMGLTRKQFRRSFARVSQIVEEKYQNGEQDRIFKGKWYTLLLAATIREFAGNTPINSTSLENRLPSVVMMTLNFDEPWADHYKEPLREVLENL